MLNRALKDTNRYVTPSSNPDIADLSCSRTLVIDCEKLNKAKSDADVINELAYQTGISDS
jgi:hypothetical protein